MRDLPLPIPGHQQQSTSLRGSRTPRTSNVHNIDVNCLFRPGEIARYLGEQQQQQQQRMDGFPSAITTSPSTVSDPGPLQQHQCDLLRSPAESYPHCHRSSSEEGRLSGADSVSLRQPSDAIKRQRHPRSVSLPNIKKTHCVFRSHLPLRVQQRDNVRLIDLIDEEFVVNSGALQRRRSSMGDTTSTGSSKYCNATLDTMNHPSQIRTRCPRQHRRRKSILDMMDRIDQLDDYYNVMNGSETVSTDVSLSPSLSSSSDFMTSRSYPRGVYVLRYDGVDGDDDDRLSSSCNTPLPGTFAIVSSEAYQYWNE